MPKQLTIENDLRRCRKIAGYTLKKVARMLGHKDTNTLSRWESGKVKPKIENILKLSIIYHCMVEDLYPDLRKEAIKALYPDGEYYKSINDTDKGDTRLHNGSP